MGSFYAPYRRGNIQNWLGVWRVPHVLAIFVSFNLIRKYASLFSCLAGEVALDGR